MTTTNKALLTTLVKAQLHRNAPVLSEVFQSSPDLSPTSVKSALKSTLNALPPYETEEIKTILLNYALDNLNYNTLAQLLMDEFSTISTI